MACVLRYISAGEAPMEAGVANPYETLGVSPSASADEIQSAYRKLAKTFHPDLNPGDAHAEDRFKEVAGAYDLLSDAEKRRRFDAGEIDESGTERAQRPFYREYARSDAGQRYTDDAAFADYVDADDAFAELLRRAAHERANRRGPDLRYRLPVDFVEAYRGASKRLTLPDGGTLDVTIPPGLFDGQILRLRGKGGLGTGSGGPGDALIEVEVRPDPRFAREGDDITIDLPVSLSEAVLGGQVRVPTPTGEVTMTVPKGSNSGTRLRLKGKGAPRREGGFGDEYVRLQIVLPQPPGPDLEAFVSGWAEGKSFNPRKDR